MTARLTRELWSYRELLYFFAWRDVKIRYKQTVLGALWVVLQPLATMLVFTLLLGRVANFPSDGVPRPLFYLSALIPWTYFSSTVTTISMCLISNSDLLTKIYFPRLFLPASIAISGMLDFIIASALMIVFMAYYQTGISLVLLSWPIFAAALLMLALGSGMLLAALNVRYRDIKYAVPFGIQLWFFLTPILYPVSSIPERYRWLVFMNPLSGIIDGMRKAFVPSLVIDWGEIVLSLCMTTLICAGALLFFHRSTKNLADYI